VDVERPDENEPPVLSRLQPSTFVEEIEEILDVMFWFDSELKQIENMTVNDEGIKTYFVRNCRRVVDISFIFSFSYNLGDMNLIKVRWLMSRDILLRKAAHRLFSNNLGDNFMLVVCQ
jgi:hypothetical protein